MKSKTFVNLLRKVIREEVQSIVRKELRSALNEEKVDHARVINNGTSLHKMANSIERKPRKKTKFTKDNMLNDILNETATNSDFSTMYDGPSFMQNDYPSMGATKTSAAVRAPIGIDGEVADTSKPEVKEVMTNITKDYSAIMKAIDKKKGIK